MPPSPSHTRFPRPARIAVAGLLAVGVLAAVLLTTGVIERWTGARGPSDDACGGVVSAGDVAGLLGGKDVREGKKPDPVSLGGLARCTWERGGVSVDFRIGWSDEPTLAMKALGRTGPLKPPAIPIGHDWDGVLVPGSDSARAAVLLACGNGRGKDKGDRGLVVTADAFRAGEGLRTPERAGQLAESVTRVAREAAAKWGCAAEFGRPVERVPVPEAVWPETVPLKEARGACRPLASRVGALREKAGVTGAVESPAGRAPLADCQLVDEEGEPVYWLSTYHGPFVQGEGDARDTDTATFACPRYHGQGLTALRALRDVDGDDSLRHALLRTYTERAVSLYGCGKPAYRR